MTALPSRADITDTVADKPTMKGRFGDFRDFVEQLPGAKAPAELTIASGAITPIAAAHSVDTEGDAGTDDLDNMAITGLPAGSIVRLYPANAARVVTIQDTQGGDGEFVLHGAVDFVMNDADCVIEFLLVGTQWVEQWRNDPSAAYLTEAAADALYAAIGHDHSGVYQPIDADLTAIAALDATAGMLAKTAANTYARRTIAGTSPISVSNGDGAAGAPTISISTATFLMLATAAQVFSGGIRVTPYSLGNITSFTIDPGNGPLQYGTNHGAATWTAPSYDGACDILVTNDASAGAITFSGFTVSSTTGDALTTTNTSKFLIMIRRVNSVSTYMIKALQ